MNKIVLYTNKLSPPGRAVEMTAKAIGLELEINEIKVLEGDHLSESFLKMNPQHTIPVLDDNGSIIWDSHAIIIYLVTKYAPNDSLYPEDPFIRAKVNAALHFDSGVLFARLRFLTDPLIQEKSKGLSQGSLEYVDKACELLESTLQSDYIVGNSMTLADLSCITTISTLVGVLKPNKQKYPKMYAWLDRMSELPFYNDVNQTGVDGIKKLFREILEKNNKN